MNYIETKIEPIIKIDSLYTIHYFEYPPGFHFYGEKHNFWELVYADKGEITATAGNRKILLKSGDILFHKPREWHNISVNGKESASAVIVAFDCHSEAMSFFENRALKAGNLQRKLISDIICEYDGAFSNPLNDLYAKKLSQKKIQAPGAQQMIAMRLSELFITLLRDSSPKSQQPTITVNSSNSVLKKATEYMQSRLNSYIDPKELLKLTGCSRAKISKLFKERFGTGVTEYFIMMKIDSAKKYLRENCYNVTQISELLGYNSIHYFSRQFKKATGMSPLQYSNSIRAMAKNCSMPGEK